MVRLLQATLIRVGNEEYARQNRSFGLTTLRTRHASVAGSRLEFRFRGKSARNHVVRISDARWERIVKRCQELPGRPSSSTSTANGRRRTVGSSDVNAYLREVTQSDFTAKDFRTWAGTVLAAGALRELPAVRDKRHANRNVVRAVEKRRRAARQHSRDLPPLLRAPGRDRGLPRRLAPRRPANAAGGGARLPPDEAGVLALVASRVPASVTPPRPVSAP